MSREAPPLHLLLKCDRFVDFLYQKLSPVLEMVVPDHHDLPRFGHLNSAYPGRLAGTRHLAPHNGRLLLLLCHEFLEGLFLNVLWIDLHVHHYLKSFFGWSDLVLSEHRGAHLGELMVIFGSKRLLRDQSWRTLRNVKNIICHLTCNKL